MKYEIGDTVMLRSWDDLAKEFGEDYQGDIQVSELWAFGSNKHRYGHLATIMEVSNPLYSEAYVIEAWDGHIMNVDVAEIDHAVSAIQDESVLPTFTFADLYSTV